MGSHSQAARMTTPAAVVFSLLASAAAQLCSTVQDPIKRDEGLGPWNVSRVERSGNGRNGRLAPVDNTHPLPHAFYEGDSYVLQYSVREGRKPDVIYFWQGSKSSVWEKGASAILTVDLDNKDGTMLFRVRAVCNNVGDKKPLVRTNQVEEVKTNINDDDVFILNTPKQLFLYIGKDATPEEKTTAVEVRKSLFPKKSPEVSEGAQPSKNFLSNLKP